MQILQRKISILVVLLLGCAVLPAQIWQMKAPMPTPRKGMAVAVLQDKIWVMGGSDMRHHALSTVEVFDPQGNSWNTPAPPLHHKRDNATARTWDGKIYIFGGMSDGHLVAEVEMYDPGVGNWQTVSSLPTARLGMASVVVDSTIWLIGGGTSQNSSMDVVEIYHPASNTWQTLPAHLNIARSAPMAAVVDSEVYVFGGYFYGPVNSYERYNRITQSWETVGTMLYYCGSAGYAGAGNRAWLVGGSGQGGNLNKLQIFYQNAGVPQWMEGPPLNIARRELVTAAVQDKIYAIGGRGHMMGQVLNTVEALDMLVDIRPGELLETQNFLLLSNYPNPFNSSTTIQLHLPERDEVEVAIYDALGRKLLTLFRGDLFAGVHHWNFTGVNSAGNELPSGLYFISLQGKKYRSAKQINLTK